MDYIILKNTQNILIQRAKELANFIEKTKDVAAQAELKKVDHDLQIISKLTGEYTQGVLKDVQEELGEDFQWLFLEAKDIVNTSKGMHPGLSKIIGNGK